MSDEQVQTREELITKREEIIVQLQGEWAIDKCVKSVNCKAKRIGLLVFVVGLVFSLVLVVLLPFFSAENAESESDLSFLGFMLLFVAMMGVFGLISYGIVHAQSSWYRQFGPIVVEGHRLVWNKKKGFVPERLNLHTLYSMITNETDDMVDMVLEPGSFIFVKLLGVVTKLSSRFGGSLRPVSDAELAMGAYACFYPQSPGELNAPKIMPSMFVEGNRLVKLLIEVAAINTKLNEIEEAGKPEA